MCNCSDKKPLEGEKAAPPKDLPPCRAQALVLVDAEGKAQGRVEMTPDRCLSLSLLDGEGNPGARLILKGDGSLELKDPRGKVVFMAPEPPPM